MHGWYSLLLYTVVLSISTLMNTNQTDAASSGSPIRHFSFYPLSQRLPQLAKAWPQGTDLPLHLPILEEGQTTQGRKKGKKK